MLHPNSAQGQRHIWCYIGTFPFSQHKLYGFYLQFEFSVHKMIKKTAWNTKWGDSLTFCFASHVPYMVIMTLLFIIMEGVILLVDSQLGPFCHHCLNISDMVTYIYALLNGDGYCWPCSHNTPQLKHFYFVLIYINMSCIWLFVKLFDFFQFKFSLENSMTKKLFVLHKLQQPMNYDGLWSE